MVHRGENETKDEGRETMDEEELVLRPSEQSERSSFVHQ